MIITKEKLIRLSENFIKQKAKLDRGVECAFLTGSILKEQPFLVGTTDVDITMIHTNINQAYREIADVSDDVTLDIYHYPKNYFANTRALRVDPWLGSSLCFDPVVLYGKGHWFEFILSSVEASFFLPEVILERSRYFDSQAHKSFNQVRALSKTQAETSYVFNYLQTIENAANAIACLTDKPLTTRRFFKDFEERCAGINNYDPVFAAQGLIKAGNEVVTQKDYFVASWRYYVDYFAQYTRADFYPEYQKCRLPYYQKPIEGLWQSDFSSALWIMLNTWTPVMSAMKIEQNEQFHALVSMLNIGIQSAEIRIQALDRYLEDRKSVV